MLTPSLDDRVAGGRVDEHRIGSDFIKTDSFPIPSRNRYENLIQLDNHLELLSTEGWYRYDGKKLLRKSPDRSRSRRHLVYYLSHRKEYARLSIETNRFTHATYLDFPIEIEGKTEKFSWTNLKQVQGRIWYRHHKKIFEYTDRGWVKQPMTEKEFTGLADTIEVDPLLEQLVGKLPLVSPGYLYENIAPFKGISLLTRFGAQPIPPHDNAIQLSKDLVNWRDVGSLNSSYTHLYENNESGDPVFGLPVADSYPALLYDSRRKKYIIYTRANIVTDCRYIQYATSDDLKSWSPLKTVSLDPLFTYRSGDSFYVPSFYYDELSGGIVGVLARYQLLDGEIREEVYYSSDYEHFTQIGCLKKIKLDREQTIYRDTDSMIYVPGVHVVKDGCWTLFKHPIGVRKKIHRVKMRYFGFRSWSCVKTGSFTTKVVVTQPELFLNYQTDPKGGVIVTLSRGKNQVKAARVKGDHTHRRLDFPSPLEVGAEYTVTVKISHGRVFSLEGLERPPPPAGGIYLTFYVVFRQSVIGGKRLNRGEGDGYRTIKLPQKAYRMIGRPIYRHGGMVVDQMVEYRDTIDLVRLIDSRGVRGSEKLPKHYKFTGGFPVSIFNLHFDRRPDRASASSR